MSKHETWRTKEYWRQEGGTLVLELLAIQQRRGRNGKRLLDGVIIKNGINKIVDSATAHIEGQDIVVIQTKGGRLGMYLMGQAFFSREIIPDGTGTEIVE